MNVLIKIEERNGNQAVSARDLHRFLGNKRDFSHWIKDRIQQYGLVENEDYQVFDGKGLPLPQVPVTVINSRNWSQAIVDGDTLGGRGGSQKIEYALSIDCAKQLCMVENNSAGLEARKYFIACEKKLKSKMFAWPQDYISALKALAASEEAKQAALQVADACQSETLHITDVATTFAEKKMSNGLLKNRLNKINEKIRQNTPPFRYKEVFNAIYGSFSDKLPFSERLEFLSAENQSDFIRQSSAYLDLYHGIVMNFFVKKLAN